MIHGPDLGTLKELAKRSVLVDFTRRAESDGVPPTLRAMYVRKAEQAQVVVAGGESSLIAGEAALRGVTPLQMAQAVLAMAKQGGDDLELQRMGVNLQIEAAATEGAVMAVLTGLGIALLPQVPAQVAP